MPKKKGGGASSLSNGMPQFPGGKDVLYCKICSVPPEYCQYMDTPAACDEWLEATHPAFYKELKVRKLQLEAIRNANIAAEKQQQQKAKAAPAEELDDDEAAMLEAMGIDPEDMMEDAGAAEATVDAQPEAEAEANAGGDAEAGTADVEEDGGSKKEKKEKKKKRKTRRGGANNRRQTGIINGTEIQEVTLSRVQRNKRKSVTIVQGLETFGHKLKSAAKKLGKRFACGAAVSNNDFGKDEIVIQGDFLSDMPKLLLTKFDVPIADMYVLSKGKKVPLNDLRTS